MLATLPRRLSISFVNTQYMKEIMKGTAHNWEWSFSNSKALLSFYKIDLAEKNEGRFEKLQEQKQSCGVIILNCKAKRLQVQRSSWSELLISSWESAPTG